MPIKTLVSGDEPNDAYFFVEFYVSGPQPSASVLSVFLQNNNSASSVTVGLVGGETVPEGGTASFELTLSQSASTSVTVYYDTQDGTAVNGTNYTAKSGSVTFSAGQSTAWVSVPTLAPGRSPTTSSSGSI